MRARRIWAGLASAGLLLGAGLLAAPPSAAAERSPACAWLDGLSIEHARTAQARTTDYGNLAVGEVVSVVASYNSGLGDTASLYVRGAGYATGGFGDTLSLVVQEPTDDVAGLARDVPDVDIEDVLFLDWVFGCRGASDAASPIPAWMQAYGRANADAPCIEGWNPSWDWWPNGGSGGFVCQRSIPAFG